MSEFKFSCPNCQQNIQATSEYSGLQINCPACHAPMVVPAAPDAPAPAGHHLSMAAAKPHAQSSASAAATFYSAQTVRKKKSKTGLIVGLSLGACAVAAAIIFGPTLMKKFKHGDQPDAAAQAAAQAATNTPPPRPPELTTVEIMQNVGDTYKGMTDYSAQAKTVASLDMSALLPGKTGPVAINTTSSMQLGRTNNYRLEWEQTSAGTTIKGAAWSSGKGNFVGYGPVAPGKVKTRQLALLPAASSFILSGGIADIFYSDTNNLAADVKDFTKTNGASLNGQDCYVLAGEQNHLSVLVWVNKKTFLINQIEVTLSGKIDQAELKKLPVAERNVMVTMSKIKGTITETYDNIRTNQNLLASTFETAYRPPANPAAAPSQRPSSMAGQLANPRRNRGQQPQ
jgi:hypothetical protein